MVSQIAQQDERAGWEVDAVLGTHESLWGKYRLKRCLGEGGQGKMLLAENAQGELVAIKAYDIARMPNWKATELFEREMLTLYELNVEGVPRCIELIDASNKVVPYYFIVQTYIPGQSLQDRMVQGYRFELRAVINIMVQIVRILRVLGLQRPAVIHRDIKPSNIMLTPEGKVYLVDFGASVRSTAQFGGSTFAGTAGYMAPEQTLGDASPASDVY
ncbi:MAG: serine/threonine protein kinase, partial [Proteobacteria bacterium]|nr:serine/threonine protein kinase [Pseudomonadota bacterium]